MKRISLIIVAMDEELNAFLKGLDFPYSEIDVLNEKQLESFNKMLDKLNESDDVVDVIHNLEE